MNETPVPAAPLKVLFLSQDPALIRRQLAGEVLTLAQASPLRDDVSTDEITPVAILSHYDARLGAFAHTGTQCGGEQPIGTDALRRAGIQVIVAGRRYGKGSSREHSPTAEKLAGVQMVIAGSFERIYRQNADNIGLPTSTDLALADRLAGGAPLDLQAVLLGRETLPASILAAGGLLRWGQSALMTAQPLHHVDSGGPGGADAASAPSAPSTASAPGAQGAPGAGRAPRTLFDKIVDRHRLDVPGTPRHPAPGEGVFVRADWRFIHEYYTGMAATLLQSALGDALTLQDPQRIVVFEDHSSYMDESPAHLRAGLVPNMRAMCQAQRDFAARHGLRMHRTLTDTEAAADDGRNVAGISHAMMSEHYALPGQLVAGTDSHTPHSGALGCVAFGVGTTDMANAFVTGAVRLTQPQGVRVGLSGRLGAGVTAKDLMLHLLALPWIREGHGVGKVFEFAGNGVAGLSVDERATLTNMTAELGGLTGIVAPDARTVAFLQERRGIQFTLEDWMHSDEDAPWAHRIEVDLEALEPMLARPGDPGQGLPVSALKEEVRVDMAYGGSCTAGKREDFDRYHEVLVWGQRHKLRPPAGVRVFLQYGTTAVRDYCIGQGYDRTFAAMGVRILQPSCGACANCGPGSSTDASEVTVSAINRNFPGRSGPGQVWLASPLTVMASALAGRLTSFGALRARHGD